MDYGLRMMLGGGMFFWLIPLLLFILIIYSGYRAFGPDKQTESASLLKLKERYARGDIDENEYLEMKEKLQ